METETIIHLFPPQIQVKSNRNNEYKRIVLGKYRQYNRRKSVWYGTLVVIPINATGSLTTYYTDVFYFENSQVNYSLVGNCTADALRASAFFFSLMCMADYSEWYIGASLSCKPLATAS